MKNITKGFALKITKRNNEPYYKSVKESFNSEKEVDEYINNLNKDTEVIGVIDIPKEKINESLSEVEIKEKGLDILTRHAKKKYPFIKRITRSDYPMLHALYVDIEIDLMKFYEFTHTHPGKEYIEKDFLTPLLFDRGSYLTRYIADEFAKDYGWEYNESMEKYLTKFIHSLIS